MTYSNPPLVVRLPEAQTWGDDIGTELVSRAPQAVQWKYGDMRGGTNAVYDAGFGGYVTFFHSNVQHDVEGNVNCRGRKKTYYMGAAVHAAEPPFEIQLMTPEPLVCPEMYEKECGAKRWWVVFPLGLLITPDVLIVSYGTNDDSTRVIRFDRARMAELLEPPVPATWDGKLLTNC